MNDNIKIGVITNIESPSLYARKTWQVLFDIYRQEGGDLNEMDSLLCDLRTLESFFHKTLNYLRYGTSHEWTEGLYWEFGNRGHTDISTIYKGSDCYKVNLVIEFNKYHETVEKHISIKKVYAHLPIYLRHSEPS